MSAYIVDKKHILYLVSAAVSPLLQRSNRAIHWQFTENGELKARKLLRTATPDDLADIANMLWRENMASVGTRYAGESSATLPGPRGESFVITAEDFARPLWREFTPAQLFKACDCYAYQTCEHDAWAASEAHAFLDSLRNAAWHALPGYEDAAWGAPQTIADETPLDRQNFLARQAERMAANEAAREAAENLRREKFIQRFGAGEQITVRPGEMAIVAELNYDNSDTMTDYFDRHHGVGPEFVLAVVKSGRETETRARAAVAAHPELAAIPFEWHTEKWSMGHGNYLEATGGYVDLSAEYTGGKSVTARWEITFRKCGAEPFTRPAFKRNAATSAPVTPAPAPKTTDTADSAVQMRHNKEKGGLELAFAIKPAPAILEKLKAAGWRWSRFASCWYTRATAEAEAFAAEIVAAFKSSQTV